MGHEDRGAWDWEQVPQPREPKLVINETQWRIFAEAGFDMRRYVLNRPLPPTSGANHDKG
jgi:hypothetical protein